MKRLKAYSNTFRDFAILIIIFLFTFQKFEPLFGTGLDKSYIWALNWLFVHDYNTLVNLIYPIGPLGFFKIPTVEGNNFLIAFFFYTFLKLSFIALLLKLDSFINSKRKIFSVVLVMIVSYFADLDLLIIGSSFVLVYFSIRKQNLAYYLLAAIIASLGLFIKSSIGISALSMVFIMPFVSFYLHKNKKQLLIQVSVVLGIFVLMGLLVFKDLNLFLSFLYGIIKLSSSYSESLSLHPENNWVVLSLFILTLAIIPVLNKDKKVSIVFLLLLFPLFVAWKHSMSREDFHHYYKLISFVIVFIGILIIISSKKNRFLLYGLPLSVLLLYFNMTNLPDYKSLKIEISGINNFLEPLLDNNTFEKKYRNISEKNISQNKLNVQTKESIGRSTIDVYPWDLSYIAANNLNWKNRQTLEVGASTSQWVSAKAAQSYSGNDDSLEFVLFHLTKNKYQGWFGSLDGRYILNDEPLLIFNLLNNYSIIEKEPTFLLFKKNKSQNFSEQILSEEQIVEFGKWVDIPDSENEIIRLKAYSEKSFAGKLKTFLFKGEEYFIDYLFEDGKTLTFRYITATAVDGLWCSPFIQNPFSDVVEQDVIKVRLRNSSSLFVSKSIKIAFERIKVKPTKTNVFEIDNANELFLKHIKNNDQTILNIKENFDSLNSAHNEKFSIVYDNAFSGNKSHKIKGSKLSYSFKYSMDSLWALMIDSTLKLEVQTDVRYLNPSSKAMLVISLITGDENVWVSKPLATSKKSGNWEYLFFNKTFVIEKHNKGILKIYVWNNGSEDIFIDDFRVSIIAKN